MGHQPSRNFVPLVPILSWFFICLIVTSFSRGIEHWSTLSPLPLPPPDFTKFVQSGQAATSLQQRQILVLLWSAISIVSYLAILVWSATTVRSMWLLTRDGQKHAWVLAAVGCFALIYTLGLLYEGSLFEMLTVPVQLPALRNFIGSVDAGLGRPPKVWYWSHLISVFGFLSAFASLAAVCSTLWDSPSVEVTTLKRSFYLVKFFPYVGALLLLGSVGRSTAVLYYYAEFLPEPRPQAAVSLPAMTTLSTSAPNQPAPVYLLQVPTTGKNTMQKIADSLALFSGVGYSLVIVATFLPAIVITGSRLQKLHDPNFQLSTTEWLGTVLAIMSPTIIGAASAFQPF